MCPPDFSFDIDKSLSRASEGTHIHPPITVHQFLDQIITRSSKQSSLSAPCTFECSVLLRRVRYNDLSIWRMPS